MAKSEAWVDMCKVVNVPVAWKMHNSQAMFVHGDKQAQNEIATQREKQQQEALNELHKLLDEGYKVISSHPLDLSVGTIITYTLYYEGDE